MKYLLLVFSLLAVININAQSTVDTVIQKPVVKKLSKEELQIAKAKYMQMMQSETYILKDKKMEIMVQKLNGVGLLPANFNPKAVMTTADVKNTYSKILTENLNKTKFKTVEEGLEMAMATFELSQKVIAENADLYALMRRASLEQMSQITEPKKQQAFDKHYEMQPQPH